MHTHSAQHNDAVEVTARLPHVHHAETELELDAAKNTVLRTEETAYVELDLLVPTPVAHASKDIEPKDAAVEALELAATRAEVNRLQRAAEELQRAVRLRDGWLHTAQQELKAAEDERRKAQAQLQEAREQIKQLSELVASLKIDLDALRATEPTSGEYAAPEEFDPEHPPRLEPVGQEGSAVLLDRKVITIGRTSESDLCVASPLVSRDHARLLVSSNTVTIVDVGSVNGCFVNNRQVKKQVLREGDILRIADRAFRLTI